MTKKKIILIIIALLVAGGGWYAYSEYTRKPKTAKERATEVVLTAEDLRKAYENEEAANKKYTDKVIEISGIVREVSPNGNRMDLVLETSDPDVGVTVQLVPEDTEKAKQLKLGSEVIVKGICNGKLIDIELNKGTIIKP